MEAGLSQAATATAWIPPVVVATFRHVSGCGECWTSAASIQVEARCARRLRPCRSALENVADDVGGLVLRFVIRPRLKLRKQSDGDQLKPGQDQQPAKKQERPIRDRLLAHQPHEREIPGDDRSEKTHSKTDD